MALVGVFLFCWGPYASLSLAGRLTNFAKLKYYYFIIREKILVCVVQTFYVGICTKYKSKLLKPDARNPGAELLCAAGAHRVPAADGQDLGPLEPFNLHLHEHLGIQKF